jgi:ABC-type branched-subunit amino acid transport system ATPase component
VLRRRSRPAIDQFKRLGNSHNRRSVRPRSSRCPGAGAPQCRPPEQPTGSGLVPPAITVCDNLRLGGYARYDPCGVERDIEMMEAFFPVLAQKRTAKGSDLSGGQQQMLAIARGLMARPRILLLDEPSLGLAPIVVKEVRKIIGSVQEQLGTAILLVEQNASLALAVADRGYIMQTGRIVASGTITELRTSQLMREAYLGDRERDAGAAGSRR